MTQKPLISAQNLSVHYALRGSLIGPTPFVRAVENVSLEIAPGSFFGLVGESGSGKTTLGRAMLRAAPISKGDVLFDDGEVAYSLKNLGKKELKEYRKRAQLIFQDPYAALHPRKTIGQMLAEVLRHYKTKAISERIEELLEQVGLEKEMQVRYPHQLSGGQRQRAVIARALAPKPKLIICDEAVSALDISIQAQVLNLLNRLKKQLGLSYLFISHDMAVVRYVSDRILVLNRGKMETLQEADQLFLEPNNAYTQKLIDAIL